MSDEVLGAIIDRLSFAICMARDCDEKCMGPPEKPAKAFCRIAAELAAPEVQRILDERMLSAASRKETAEVIHDKRY